LGTQQHTLWSTLQRAKGQDLDDFFDKIYEQSCFRMMEHRDFAEDTIDPHDCIRALPGPEEYPLWRIQCRVRLSLKTSKKNM
jgi:hypothetical protein